VKVRDIMTTEVVVAHPETSVNVVARLMAGRGISGVPVVDDGRVVGIVTELDLVLRNTRLEPPAFFKLLDALIPLETPAHYRERLRHMLGTHARDVMNEEFVTVGPDDDLEVLADIMFKKRANPVAVVEDDRLVGIVSRSDIVGMMARDIEAGG